MTEEEWDDHWKKSNIISDYHLIYYNLLSEISKKIPKGSKILEAGCGSGKGMSCFQGHNVYGIDISEKALELSSKYGTVVKGDIRSIPFKENVFDFTFNSGVIEHLPKPKEAISEMMRVTKPGGKVLIMVPNKYCIFYQMYRMLFWHIEENPYSFSRFKKEFFEYRNKKFFGLHAFIPFASSKTELLPEKIRSKIVKIDKIIPFKKYHAYAIGVILTKE